MRERRANSSSKLFLAVVAALTLCSLAILLTMMRDFENRTEERIRDVQRVFSDPALMRPGQPVFSFEEIESAAAKYENQGDFGAITVTRRASGEDHIVYPYYLPAVAAKAGEKPTDKKVGNYPLPWKITKDVRVLPLASAGEMLGKVFVRINSSTATTMRAAVASLGALLVASIFLFLMQFRQQEITITRTTVELEEKRRELVRLERLALAGQISANIFHDLKKPILNIKNEAEELEPSSPEYPIASRIRKQIELFFGILRETSLERFVRAGEDTEYVDINDVLDRSVALVQYEQGNVNIERSYESGLPLVFSQPVRLIQVFSNLILNAYQAMEGRGNLVLRSMLEDGGIVVEVQDNGPGIPAESQARIFQPFYTTKPAGQGTGLGLYIVHEIVKDAGGSVSVKSAPGSTSFRVRLPAATHEA